MKTTGKTILITGGGSGIGFAAAKLLSENGNQVIITGRNEEKLKAAASQLQNVAYFAADVSNEADVDKLADFIGSAYPLLDVLINNAAETNVYKLGAGSGSFEKAKGEVATTYLAVVNLTEKLLPLLQKQAEPAIVNVNAIIGLAPSVYMPTHSASKAALRAYTQVLRLTLAQAQSPVKVFELYPPLVKTEFSKAIGSETSGIPADDVATALIEGLENNVPDIYVGQAEKFYQGFFAGTEPALAFLNQPRG